jgi:hypothetical protein
MKHSRLHRALAFSLLAASLLAASPSCGLLDCDDGEYEATAACDKLTKAVNEVLSSCGVSSVNTSTVCGGEVCDKLSACEPNLEVDRCETLIRAMDCDEAQSRAYVDFGSCIAIFDTFASSCSASGDDDWD